jgi:hypothetical protein
MTVLPFRRPLPEETNDPIQIDAAESQLLARWTRTAQELDIAWMHAYNGAKVCQYGFPDLALCDEEFWLIELKSTCGTLSPAQERWRRRLMGAGVNYAVHTPADWISGKSLQLLERIAGDADVIDLRRAA